MEPTETHPQQPQSIDDRFKELAFSKTAGYMHYGASDPEDSARRAESVDSFLQSSDIEEPIVEPTKHDWDTVRKTIDEYEALAEEILARPTRTLKEEAQLDQLVQKTGELFRYEELMLAMGAASMGERNEHRRQAANLSIEIIGGLDKSAFGSILNETVDLAESSENPVALELQKLVGRQEQAGGEYVSFDLELETREKISADLETIYPGLNALYWHPEGETTVNAEGVVDLCNQLFKIAGFDDSWRAELSDGKSARTAGSEHRVYVGKDRADLPNRRAAVGLAFHEAIVHGSRSRGKKVAGSLDFEEGLATRLQQIISGEVRTPGKQYYLSIGLQAGLDRGGEPRTYRETFEILWRRELLLMQAEGRPVDVVKARSEGQRQVHRTRRGGAVDTRDSSYFIGAQKAAVWLNDIATLPREERIAALTSVLADCYDPTNPEHVDFIQSTE